MPWLWCAYSSGELKLMLNDIYITFEQHKMALTHYILSVDLKYYQIIRSNCILYKLPTVWLHHKGNQTLKWPACCSDLSHFKHNKKKNIMKTTPTSWAAEIMSRTSKEVLLYTKIILSVKIINCEVSSVVFSLVLLNFSCLL